MRKMNNVTHAAITQSLGWELPLMSPSGQVHKEICGPVAVAGGCEINDLKGQGHLAKSCEGGLFPMVPSKN